MKVAIIGSRNFNDYPLLEKSLSGYLSKITHIVSGGARGADSLGKKYATLNNKEYIEFLPDWETYGKGAGFIRNRSIINEADMVFAFWDGVSKGTRHSIGLANEMNKDLTIVKFKDVQDR